MLKQTRRRFLKNIGLVSTIPLTISLNGCLGFVSKNIPAKNPNFLFILVDDLGEKNNLAEKMTQKTIQLKAMLDDWRKIVDAKMLTISGAK